MCGASAGLGRELSLQLAQQRVSHLAIIARGKEGLQSLQTSLTAEHPDVQVEVWTADLADQTQVESVALAVRESLGQLDLVIQAVGQSDRGTILETSGNSLKELFDVNVTTCLNAIQAFHPCLEKASGTFVLIGSLASLFAPRYLGGYSLVKHSVAALAQQARLELAKDNIHVMLACPGPIKRDDGGQRYAKSGSSSTPDAALNPGGGAKLKGLDVGHLAKDILSGAAARKRLLVRPRSARLLQILSAISPWLGDWVLSRKTT